MMEREKEREREMARGRVLVVTDKRKFSSEPSNHLLLENYSVMWIRGG